jgi:hypothetical protein
MKKCQRCKVNDAIWIVQYIASNEPTFTLPGNHYRGFKTMIVCESCKREIEGSAEVQVLK